MASECPKLVRGRVMRLTRLDDCGVPVIGASTTVVTKGLIAITPSPQYESSDPIRLLDANGDLCINEPGKQNLAQIDTEIQFCGVNIDAFNIIAGAPLVLDDATPTPNTVGFRIRTGASTVKFALEVWSQISGQSCTTGTQKWWYHLFPLLTSAQWGDFPIANDAVNFTITASAYDGSGWGVGPYDVINALPGPAPSPLLTPMGASDVYDGQVTTLAPPSPSCGVQALAA